jgi:thymidine kinase
LLPKKIKFVTYRYLSLFLYPAKVTIKIRFSYPMFIENPSNRSDNRGWIEVITGSMFSGKTEELIRRLKRARIAMLHVEIFKPRMDTRYSEEEVISHDENAIMSTPVSTAGNILLLASGVDVVGVDEAQFFDMGLIEVCNKLANGGTRVIVAGLDMDFKGRPFGPIPGLIATAEFVTKVHAICVRCGNIAHHTHRKLKTEKLVVLGEKDLYEPLCRKCYQEALSE